MNTNIRRKLIIIGFIPFGIDGNGLRIASIDEKGKRHAAQIWGCEMTFINSDGSTETYLIDTLASIRDLMMENFPWAKEHYEKEFNRFL